MNFVDLLIIFLIKIRSKEKYINKENYNIKTDCFKGVFFTTLVFDLLVMYDECFYRSHNFDQENMELQLGDVFSNLNIIYNGTFGIYFKVFLFEMKNVQKYINNLLKKIPMLTEVSEMSLFKHLL